MHCQPSIEVVRALDGIELLFAASERIHSVLIICDVVIERGADCFAERRL